MPAERARLRVFTWHVHGAYLYYLAHAAHDFFVPVRPGRPDGYVGLPPGGHPWPDNLHEVAAEDVRRREFDVIVFQSARQWHVDQYDVLSAGQRRLPRIYLEHDPPRQHPTDTRHPVDDPGVLLVHVTPFNALMWESGRAPTRVIEHGVVVPPDVRYTGEIPRALAVVNNLAGRGRRLGADVLAAVQREAPVDLIGVGSLELGGLGEIPHDRLAAFEVRYRVFFNPIRYTSLGLAVCEAMMLGMPVVGLATTEMVSAVANGVSGYIETDVGRLGPRLNGLLADPAEARRLGAAGRRRALDRFHIDRFTRDWDAAFALVTGRGRARATRPMGVAS